MTAKRRFFGTDGIRGEAGKFPLSPEMVEKIGLASGLALGRSGARVLVGCDTRESCSSIKDSLFAGFSAAGVVSYDAGVFPTPAVSAMVKEKGFDFGVVVSASHNPYLDNGIKFFSGGGGKLDDALEEVIERLIDDPGKIPASAPHRVRRHELSLDEDYIVFLLNRFEGPDLGGVKVVLDTANGAAFKVAPRLFSRLEADVIELNNSPDGRNINRNCGSLYASGLGEKVKRAGAAFGFSFDGDADRCLAALPDGRVLDGDFLLFNEAVRRRAAGRLGANLVVGTVMSNYGLEEALCREKIGFKRAQVGDRYVLEVLRENGGILGGEPSGHILFLDKSGTGDGLLTSLAYASLAMDKGGMEKLSEGLTMYHQRIVNLKVEEKKPLDGDLRASSLLKEAEEAIGGEGRIVLRYSGTEPLLRIMVEARGERELDLALGLLTEGFRALLRKED